MTHAELHALEDRNLTPDYFDNDLLHLIPTIPDPKTTTPRTLYRLAIWTHPHVQLALFARSQLPIFGDPPRARGPKRAAPMPIGTPSDEDAQRTVWLEADEEFANDTHTLDPVATLWLPLRTRKELHGPNPIVLAQLANDPSTYVRRVLTFSPYLTEELLHQLATDPSSPVRHMLTQRDILPPPIIEILANDSDSLVRTELIANHPLPRPLIDNLAQHPDPYTREAIARLHDLPSSLITAFAHSPHPTDRMAIARHPNLPDALKRHLASDPHEHVRYELRRRRDLPDDIRTALKKMPRPATSSPN